eukprot:5799780-Alexandrium_andersonii.AAC.1
MRYLAQTHPIHLGTHAQPPLATDTPAPYSRQPLRSNSSKARGVRVKQCGGMTTRRAHLVIQDKRAALAKPDMKQCFAIGAAGTSADACQDCKAGETASTCINANAMLAAGTPSGLQQPLI